MSIDEIIVTAVIVTAGYVYFNHVDNKRANAKKRKDTYKPAATNWRAQLQVRRKTK